MLKSLEFFRYGWVCGFHFIILIFSGLWNLLAPSLEWVSFGLFTTTITKRIRRNLASQGRGDKDETMPWIVVTLQKIASNARSVFTLHINEVKIKKINIFKVSSLNTRTIFASAVHFLLYNLYCMFLRNVQMLQY